jgi:hypothetical protein
MTSTFRLIVFAALFFALWSAREFVVAAPAAQRVSDIQLPPITYLCPMNGSLMADGSIHADVYEDAAGTCAICKMTLAAARLESIWTCPVHSVIHERKAGVCPIDKRELVQMTVALSWTCASNPEIDQLYDEARKAGLWMGEPSGGTAARLARPRLYRGQEHCD